MYNIHVTLQADVLHRWNYFHNIFLEYAFMRTTWNDLVILLKHILFGIILIRQKKLKLTFRAYTGNRQQTDEQ